MNNITTTILTALLAVPSLRAAVVNRYDAAADTATPGILEDLVGTKNFGATNVTRAATTSAMTDFTHAYSLSSTNTADGGVATPFFNPGGANHSYELWVKPGALTSEYQVIFETGAQGAGTGIFVNNAGFRVLQGNGNAVEFDVTIPLAGFATSDFIQLTVTVDDANDDLVFHANGASGGSATLSDLVGTIGSGNNDAGLFSPASSGANTSNVGNTGGVGNPNIFTSVGKFQGEIALFNVYDEALTATQVRTAFESRIVPEPGVAVLGAFGFLALLGRRR